MKFNDASKKGSIHLPKFPFWIKIDVRLKTFSFSKTKLTSVTEKLNQHGKRVFKPPLQFNAKFFRLQIDQLTRHIQFIIHYESTHPCVRGRKLKIIKDDFLITILCFYGLCFFCVFIMSPCMCWLCSVSIMITKFVAQTFLIISGVEMMVFCRHLYKWSSHMLSTQLRWADLVPWLSMMAMIKSNWKLKHHKSPVKMLTKAA